MSAHEGTKLSLMRFRDNETPNLSLAGAGIPSSPNTWSLRALSVLITSPTVKVNSRIIDCGPPCSHQLACGQCAVLPSKIAIGVIGYPEATIGS